MKVISGSNSWRNLAGKRVECDSVFISEMGDIHPFNPAPLIESRVVFLDFCDKNFVYYWLTKSRRVFPVTMTYFLNSHPCEPDVLRHLEHEGRVVYLHERFWRYKERWVPSAKTTFRISSETYEYEKTRRKFTQNENRIRFD